MAELKDMPDLYIINIKPRHWEICRKDTTFGIPRGAPTPFKGQGRRWKRDDVCIVRETAPNYGVRAIWYFESEKRLRSQTENPWKDFDCEWLVQLRSLVEFKTRLSEEFKGKRKYSPKMEMFASRLYRSVLRPTQQEAHRYAKAFLVEKPDEMVTEASYMGNKVRVDSLLESVIGSQTRLVLEQHSAGLSEYDDQIGVQYHYPKQYFNHINEGNRFIYCRPKKGERGQEVTTYFGTGTIGIVRKDTTREGHRYCQIENYFEFPKEVPYVDTNGVYLETSSHRQPVMRSAVREISTEAFDRIVKLSQLENDMDIAALLKVSEDAARVKQLDEAYQNATPQKQHVITTRIERDTAIGGKVKELNKYVCQICGFLPFTQRTGRPFAEAHHVIPLHKREPGSLASQNVICVCANCHRKMHYGNTTIVEVTSNEIIFEIDGQQIHAKRNRV
jgi:putative restriction endonuclease